MNESKRIANMHEIKRLRRHLRCLTRLLAATTDKKVGAAISEGIRNTAERIEELEREQCRFAAEQFRRLFCKK